MNSYEKISNIATEFFFNLDFKQMEQIFNVKLFGLSEEETEIKLDEIRETWNAMDWNSIMKIINDND